MLDKDKTQKFNGKTYPAWHGSPFDRGSADSWYSRVEDPHYWPAGTYKGKRVERSAMTPAEVEAYFAGYQHNEECGGKKEWD